MLEAKVNQMLGSLDKFEGILQTQVRNSAVLNQNMKDIQETLRLVVSMNQEQARQSEQLKAFSDKCDERHETTSSNIEKLFKLSGKTKCSVNSEKIVNLEKEITENTKRDDTLSARLWVVGSTAVIALLSWAFTLMGK